MHVAGISGFGTLILPGPKVPPQLITTLATVQLPTLPYISVSFSPFVNSVYRSGLPNMQTVQLYDVARKRFDVPNFYCHTAKLNTRSILHPCVFLH